MVCRRDGLHAGGSARHADVNGVLCWLLSCQFGTTWTHPGVPHSVQSMARHTRRHGQSGGSWSRLRLLTWCPHHVQRTYAVRCPSAIQAPGELIGYGGVALGTRRRVLIVPRSVRMAIGPGRIATRPIMRTGWFVIVP
jgi:hypothetical protein